MYMYCYMVLSLVPYSNWGYGFISLKMVSGLVFLFPPLPLLATNPSYPAVTTRHLQPRWHASPPFLDCNMDRDYHPTCFPALPPVSPPLLMPMDVTPHLCRHRARCADTAPALPSGDTTPTLPCSGMASSLALPSCGVAPALLNSSNA